MGGTEPPQPEYQPAGSEGGLDAEREDTRPIRIAYPLHGSGDARECIGQCGLELQAYGTDLDAPADAPEQRYAEVGLEGADLMADRGMGDMQFAGSPREAAVAGCGLKGT